MPPIRIVLVGAGDVGPAFILAFLKSETRKGFDPRGSTTFKRPMEVDGTMQTVEMRDASVMGAYVSGRDQLVQSGHAIIFAYSVTSKSSFEAMKKLHEKVNRIVDDSGVSLFLAGCKPALDHNREVREEEGKEYASSSGLSFFELCPQAQGSVDSVVVQVVRNVVKIRASSKQDSPNNAACKCSIL